jgi:hypothetical protein
MPKTLLADIKVGDTISFTRSCVVGIKAKFQVTREPYISRRLKEVSLIHKWIRVKCLDDRYRRKGRILVMGVRDGSYIKFHNK